MKPTVQTYFFEWNHHTAHHLLLSEGSEMWLKHTKLVAEIVVLLLNLSGNQKLQGRSAASHLWEWMIVGKHKCPFSHRQLGTSN